MSGNSQTYTYKFVGPDGGSDFVSATLDFESGYTALTAFSGTIDGISFSVTGLTGVDFTSTGLEYNAKDFGGIAHVTPTGGVPYTVNLAPGQNAQLQGLEAGLASITPTATPQTYTYKFTGPGGESDFLSMTATVSSAHVFTPSAISGLIDGVSFSGTNISGVQFSAAGISISPSGFSGDFTAAPKGGAALNVTVADGQSAIPGSVAAGAALLVTGSVHTANLLNKGATLISLGASLDVTNAVNPASTGLFLLTEQSTLEIAKLMGGGAQITFLGGSNTLAIDNASKFGLYAGNAYAGPILEGFQASDAVDLKGIADTGLQLNYTAASGDLKITNSGGSLVAALHFQNSTLGSGSFQIGTDHAGGSLVTLS